jgi:hypothetical protein
MGTADAELLNQTFYTSIDSVWAFVGVIDTSHPMGELPSKHLILETAKGLFSFNFHPHISAWNAPITALFGSKRASR